MIPAKLADRIDDLIHPPQRYSVHLLVEFVEVRTDLLVVVGIVFIVALIEHDQDGLSIAKVWWMGFNVRFYCFQKCFHGNTSQNLWVMLPWKTVNYK